jgi:hypothetical protein
MSKRPSSPNGSARVDAILRYRNASEGVLCSSRCRELSRSGLTATVERPVFPGELLRIDLEPPMGGPSILGLARVSWTGSDPEGAPGAAIMRLRFLSFGEASRSALTAWLQELGPFEERRSEAPSNPHDDSSVRALSRAIADSLLPPPPVLPGATPSTESSGLSPVPAVVPNRPSIPPPPGMYTRSSRTLSHPVDRVAPTVHRAMETARRSSRPPPLDLGTTLQGYISSEPEAIGPAARSRSGETSSARRTAEIRERLTRLQARRDNTPLMVPLQGARASQPARASAPVHSVSQSVPQSVPIAVPENPPPVAHVSLAPPLPLGALLNAPPETTRRSSRPPPGAAPSSTTSDELPSSSWPALRVPPSIAAFELLGSQHDSALTRVERRETIPPPASIAELPAPYPPLYEQLPERAELPLEGPSLPLSDAPWSVPSPPPRAGGMPWLALCMGSLAVGAGIAYLVYGPSFVERVRSGEPAAAAVISAHAALDLDELLASQIALPKEPSLEELAALQASGAGRPAGARSPSLGAAERPQAGAPTTRAPIAQPPPAATKPLASAAPGVPPPPPALPVALGGPAAAPAPMSRLEQARACVARGDTECVIKLLKDASNPEELELWIETLRAQGRASEARSAMQRFVDTFPNARRANAYRRILTNAP